MSGIQDRARAIYFKNRFEIFKQTDRMFGWLMIFQWLAGIAAALLISPHTWVGENSEVHLHVWAAIFLGGLISAPPIALAFLRPGQTYTRHVIGVCQMLTSALLIHLTGGRIETHFHVFGSLAFLAFYRDWKVLIPATLIVAVDHWLRGTWWPQSVFGVLQSSPWRWIEHAVWVIFEDIVLIASCLRGKKEMSDAARKTAELEFSHQIIEEKVLERTEQLIRAKEKLEAEIAERKKMQNLMVHSDKMAAIGKLAGGVAHEINNPLGVILGFAQNLIKRVQPTDPLFLPVEAITREAMRCRNLVQDLLTFSRVTKAELEEVDVNMAVETALTLINAQGKVKNVVIEKNLASGLPRICGNSTQIQQIVVNLSNNAIDAMQNGGRLKIATSHIGLNGESMIRLYIEDTGSGIEPEIQKRIFEPFFTTKEIGKGTGLGLSLVYEIVQKHNGSIELESWVGKGTAFRINLPTSMACRLSA